MKVKDIIEADPFMDMLEVVIREEGCSRWLHGYRIGKDAEVPPARRSTVSGFTYNHTKTMWTQTEPGGERDYDEGPQMPCTIIKKTPEKAPDYIKDLDVCQMIPYHIPDIHRSGTPEHMMSVWCYPSGYTQKDLEKVKKEEPQLAGQMTLDDMDW